MNKNQRFLLRAVNVQNRAALFWINLDFFLFYFFKGGCSSLTILKKKTLDTKQNLMECMNGMIQWLTQDWLDSLLDESVILNESLEWMIQRQIHF